MFYTCHFWEEVQLIRNSTYSFNIIPYLRMLDKCIYLCDPSCEHFCLRTITINILTELRGRHTTHEQKCLTVANELLFQNEAGRAVTKLQGCSKQGSCVCCLSTSKLFRKYHTFVHYLCMLQDVHKIVHTPL